MSAPAQKPELTLVGEAGSAEATPAKPYYPITALRQLMPEFPAVACFNALVEAGLVAIPTGGAKKPESAKQPNFLPGDSTYASIEGVPPADAWWAGVGIRQLGIDFDPDDRDLKLRSPLKFCQLMESRGIASVGPCPIQVSASEGLHLIYVNDPLARIATRDKTFPCVDLREGSVPSRNGGYLTATGTGLRGDELKFARAKTGRPEKKKDKNYWLRSLGWPRYQVLPLALIPDCRQWLLAKLQEADPELTAIPRQLEEAVALAESGADAPLPPMPEPLIALIVERQKDLAGGCSASTWPSGAALKSKAPVEGDPYTSLATELTEDEVLVILDELKSLAPEKFVDTSSFLNLATQIAAWDSGPSGRRCFDKLVEFGAELNPDKAEYYQSKANAEWRGARAKGLPVCRKTGNPQGSCGLIAALNRAKGIPDAGPEFKTAMAEVASRFIVVIGHKSVELYDLKLDRAWTPAQAVLANDDNGCFAFAPLMAFVKADGHGNKSYAKAVELFIRKAKQWKGIRTEIEGFCVRPTWQQWLPPREEEFYYRSVPLIQSWIKPERDDAIAKDIILRASFLAGGNYVLLRWLLHWTANRFQQPMRPAGTYPVLSSPYGGGGRTWFIEALPKALMRSRFVKPLKIEWLTQWTAELAEVVWLFSNETDTFEKQEQLSVTVAEWSTAFSTKTTQKHEKGSEEIPIHLGILLASNRKLGSFQKKGQRRAVRLVSLNYRDADRVLGPGGSETLFNESYRMLGVSEQATEDENEAGRQAAHAIAYFFGSINPFTTHGRVFGATQGEAEEYTDALSDPVREFVFWLYHNAIGQGFNGTPVPPAKWGEIAAKWATERKGAGIHSAYKEWLATHYKMGEKEIAFKASGIYDSLAMLTTLDGRPMARVRKTAKERWVSLNFDAIRDHLAAMGVLVSDSGPDEEDSQQDETPTWEKCEAAANRFWVEDYLPGLEASKERRAIKHQWVEEGYQMKNGEQDEE